MYIDRNVDFDLEQWSLLAKRKPLLLRGARQVGKSSCVRHLGKKFNHFVEINFDEKPELSLIFENSLDPVSICEQLSIATQTPIIEGKTLLFLDEIQTSVAAISSLRYFYEKMPQLHVIAAGSLLEFVLAEIPSFGVGRVRSVFMYPICFYEFLKANGESQLLELLKKSDSEKPLATIFHEKLKTYLKKFLIVGGMPEAVNAYLTDGNMLEVQRVLDDLIISLEVDFVKYKKQIAVATIREVFNAVVGQMGQKFSYTYPNATLNNGQVKQVLELLKMAGLIHDVTHTAANGIPLGAKINIKMRKYLLLDTGIFQRILGLDIASLLIEDNFKVINKGHIAELFVGLELLKNESSYNRKSLYYWQREAKNSQAEVDFVIQKQVQILPIEVKSGTKGTMQSMYLFLKEKNINQGLRLSLENFGATELIDIMPLYAVGNLVNG
jgi:uncharacterized protein